MRFGPYTNYDGSLITNTTILVRPVGDPGIDAAGNVTAAIGLPLRVTVGADGMFTNALQPQNYFVTNALGGPAYFNKGYLFRAPFDTGPTVYSTTAPGILVTGMNYFITLNAGTNGGGNVTFNNVTNALGGLPIFTTALPGLTNGYIRLLEATNVANAFVNSSSNSLYLTHPTYLEATNIAKLVTNGLSPLIFTNVAQVLYTNALPALTNGFVDRSITNNYTTIALLNSASNSLQGQIVGGSVTSSGATNIAAFQIGQSNATFSSLVYTNPLQVLMTNRLPALTNGFVDRSITNNYTTVALLNSSSNSIEGDIAKKANTNSPTIWKATALGLDATNYVLRAEPIDAPQQFSATNGAFVFASGAGTPNESRISISTFTNAGGQGDILGPQGQNIGFNALGELALQNSGGVIVRLNDSSGVTIDNGNSQDAVFDASGNFSVTGGGWFIGNGFGLTNTSTTNLTLGALGQVTNIVNTTLSRPLSSLVLTNKLSITNGAYANLYLVNGAFLRTNSLAPFDWEFHNTNGTVTYGTNATTKETISTGGITVPNGILSAGSAVFSTTLNAAGSAFQVDGSGNVLATAFSGNGAFLTSLNGANLTDATVNSNKFDADTLALIRAIGIDAATATNIANVRVAVASNVLAAATATASNFNATANATSSNFLYVIELPKTNGSANALTASNTTLLGNVAFGFTGAATNIIASTNVIEFWGAGSSLATNGVFVWNSGGLVYTNWLNGAYLTNNGSAWLMITNGVTLYSLAGTGLPVGGWSAVNGALPAPGSGTSFYFNFNGVAAVGYLSATNISTISNSIVTNIVSFSTNNYIAITNGIGTNTSLFQPIIYTPLRETNLAIGYGNIITAGNWNVIGGGFTNWIYGNATFNSNNVIGGGNGNVITNNCIFDTIAGGYHNVINGQFQLGSDFIVGKNNTITWDGSFNSDIPSPPNGESASSILGFGNTINGKGSTVIGRNITQTNWYSFTANDAYPVTSLQNYHAFLSFSNGVSINTPASSNALTVNGTISAKGFVGAGAIGFAALSTNGSTSGQVLANLGDGTVGWTNQSGTGTQTPIAQNVDYAGFSETNIATVQLTNRIIFTNSQAQSGIATVTPAHTSDGEELAFIASHSGSGSQIAILKADAFKGNGFTASTLLEADANKKAVSIPNAAGVLTNNGSGGFGFASILDASALVTNQYVLTGVTTNLLSTQNGILWTNLVTPPLVTDTNFVMEKLGGVLVPFSLSTLIGMIQAGGGATNAISTALTNGTVLAGGLTNLNYTNCAVLPYAANGQVNVDGSAITYLHEGTGTNITATFKPWLQSFTITNGPDVFFHYAGANGSVSYQFQTNVTLHFDYQPKWLAGSNNVITNGVLSITSYGGTNAVQLEAAIKENQ